MAVFGTKVARIGPAERLCGSPGRLPRQFAAAPHVTTGKHDAVRAAKAAIVEAEQLVAAAGADPEAMPTNAQEALAKLEA